MAAIGPGVAQTLPNRRLPHDQMAILYAGNARQKDDAQGQWAGDHQEREDGQMIERICRWWCRHFHRSIYLPMGGVYACRRCLRTYEAGYR